LKDRRLLIILSNGFCDCTVLNNSVRYRTFHRFIDKTWIILIRIITFVEKIFTMPNLNIPYLFGSTIEELKEIVVELELPKFTAQQLAGWLYQKDVASIDEMSNLSKGTREKLKQSTKLGIEKPLKVQVSSDGTKKYLFAAEDKFIETAFIPDDDRGTLCVSSQVGCKMACTFCMTGKQGFQNDLSPSQILNQLKSIPESKQITNLVFMGMGEPFDNIDNVLKTLEILTSSYGFGMASKRINVSSIGYIKGLKRFLTESDCHLAISLHNPFPEERIKLMPIEKTNPIKEVLNIIREHDFGRYRRVLFEYIMFKDFNDTERHVKELAKILNGIKCRINLIRFHQVPGIDVIGSDDETIFKFQNQLKSKGIITTLRTSRGLDIAAACGLLSTKELLKIQ
jgi:23S rRNA (adenine2503-C2)-methyltransferase